MPQLPSICLQGVWTEIWHAKGLETGQHPSLQPLLDAYSEPQRYYHTLQHLQECFLWWRHCFEWMQLPYDVALALFYHDAVYVPKRHDNEGRSVLLMHEHLRGCLSAQELTHIDAWILATAEHQACTDSDLKWLLDIDLAILGADSERFQEYERQIRLEYRHVPLLLYRLSRKQLFKHFHSRRPLYQTEFFRLHLEAKAKRNLQAS